MARLIYLDHNATTPLAPEAAAAMAACQTPDFGNPASQHQAGRRARQVVEEARERVGVLLGARLTGLHPDRVIFTSGGTESNNLALFGLAGAAPGEAAISAIEHPSVVGVAEQLERRGWKIHRLAVSPDGVVRLDQLKELLQRPLRFVSVMLGNNETGVIQPIAEIAALCAAAQTPLHVDAAQAVGKIPVDFSALGAAGLSLAAHKFHGPIGIGALIVRGDVDIEPLMHGGFHQGASRPGTESAPLAAGLRAALEAYDREAGQRSARMRQLRDRFEQRLKAGYPNLVINGADAARLPQTSNIAFLPLDRQALFMALDLAGVACSTGSACASGSSQPSPVLAAMGCDQEVIGASLRFSLGATTTEADVDEATERILSACGKMTRITFKPQKSAF